MKELSFDEVFSLQLDHPSDMVAIPSREDPSILTLYKSIMNRQVPLGYFKRSVLDELRKWALIRMSYPQTTFHFDRGMFFVAKRKHLKDKMDRSFSE